MPTIQVIDLPEHIYRALKETAQKERRSLSQQIVISLSKALELEVDLKSRRRKVLKEIEGSNQYNSYRNADVISWVQEDRSER